MLTNSELPDFDYHDSGLVSLLINETTLEVVLENVREGLYSVEEDHEFDAITLVDIKLSFINVSNIRVDGDASERLILHDGSGEISSLTSVNREAIMTILWVENSPLRTSYQTYSFNWETRSLTPIS